MNQILSVEPPQPKKQKEKKQKVNNSYNSYNSSGPIEIDKIARFFAIVLIVFGIIMVGSGSYSMYKGSQIGNTQVKPTIYVEEISETQLNIQVTHNSPLRRVTYNWNSEEQVELDASGKRSVEQTIEIPTGENTLNIYAVDQQGKETNLSRIYTRQGDIAINFEVEGSNLKVTANGINQLSYMTYRWDENEEQRIDINNMSTEQLIEIPMGQHTLTVSVVDINNNTETKEQEVKGVTKPTVTINRTENNFVINASDEEGLTRIEVRVDQDDNQQFLIDLEKVYPNVEDRKQFEYSGFALHDGRNTLEVTVYNVNGVSEEAGVLVNK